MGKPTTKHAKFSNFIVPKLKKKKQTFIIEGCTHKNVKKTKDFIIKRTNTCEVLRKALACVIFFL
jgi:hypothetical protein